MDDVVNELYYLYLRNQSKLVKVFGVDLLVINRLGSSNSVSITTLKGYWDYAIRCFLTNYGLPKQMVPKDD